MMAYIYVIKKKKQITPTSYAIYAKIYSTMKCMKTSYPALHSYSFQFQKFYA